MIRLTILIIATVVLGFPIAGFTSHGMRPSLWPGEMISPDRWFFLLTSFQVAAIFSAYVDMAVGRSSAFSHGGLVQFWLLSSPSFAGIALSLFGKPKQQLRANAGVYGDARFATSSELRALNTGLELGIDPATGRAVRVEIEGTILTLAPPRQGKTWGLLIPALAFAEPAAWDGPAVIIDSKGEVYRAVHERRRALGRRVACLDPLSLVGGKDTWNPLANVDSDDILYLQRTALALLPDTGDTGSEASAYFRIRAVDLIVGAMIVALRSGNPTPAVVRDLLDDERRITDGLRLLGPHPATLTALSIMESDPKTRDPVWSTANQAFQWLGDSRMATFTNNASFDFDDLSSGTLDIFLVVPPEYRNVLAPALRWFLSDLFAAVRRHRPRERVLAIVDETAATLGRFSELLTAATELPGYGLSIWTAWQDVHQLKSLFGEAGAATLINTAEVVTVSNISAADPAETERWSKVLGDFTALVTVETRSSEITNTSTSFTPQVARLLPPGAIATMPPDQLLALVNNWKHSRRPLRLKKTKAFDDPRYSRFVRVVRPVKTAGR